MSYCDTNIGGLVFFLAAHIAYVVHFYHNRILISSFAVLVPLTLLALYILLPSVDGGLKAPVIVYSTVITVMTGFALSRYRSASGTEAPTALFGALGAVSFLLSDTILAFNKFHSPFDSAHFWVMVTYYFGQTLIAASSHLNAIVKKNKVI